MYEKLQLLCILRSQQESQMACDLLKSNDIDAFSRGAKEYASLITGGDVGRYEILVPEDQIDIARHILKEKIPDHVRLVIQTERSPNVELKRALLYAFMAAIILPIVFNIASLIALKNYIRIAPTSSFKNLWIALVVILNLCAVFLIYMLIVMRKG